MLQERIPPPTPITVALDAMGGDFGPEVVVPAAVSAVQRHTDLKVILVGERGLLERRLTQHPLDQVAERLHIHHTSQTVGMDEPPAQALRFKKDSSMRVAIDLVKDSVAQACVSAGNTGALIATARFVLKTLPGIERPAIEATIPSLRGHTHMLDLGANVDCKAHHLVQFAIMGTVLVNAVDEIERPRVGLLNVGQEAIKGNEQVKRANQLLQGSAVNYIGYVEGDGIYLADVDVVVCDGFVGNVALKASEGVAKIIAQLAREEFKRNVITRLRGLVALPVLRSFRERIDPRRYNGASLLGLQGIVIKSHGGADAFSFGHAIDIAYAQVQKSVVLRIGRQIEVLLNERQPA